jgi:Protein of unknown function (DUF2637)
MSESWVRAGRAAVIVVGVIVAAISYSHIRDWALAHGGDWLTAPLLPLGIDGAVVAMTLFMHQAAGLAQWLSRCGLLVSIGATVAFNTAYGAEFGVAAALGWSIPPVLLVICIEVSVLTVRKTRPTVSDTVTAVTPVTEAPPPVAASPDRRAQPREGVPLLTVKQQAAKAKVSERTMYRRLAKGDMVTAGTNGEAH